jgi:hypothetical protein
MADDFAGHANQVRHRDMAVDEAQALIPIIGGVLTLGKFVEVLRSENVATMSAQAVKDAGGDDPNENWVLHCARQIAAHPGKFEKWEYIYSRIARI